VVGKREFHRKDFHAATEQFAAVRRVKNVMVETAVVDVVKRAALKLLHRDRPWINTEIVFLQDLRQVKQIVFRSILLKVLKHVVDRRWRSLMIEGSAVIRQKQDQTATGPGDSLPLVERLDRVGEVLQVVRRQYEVIAVIRYGGQVRGIHKNILPRWLARTKPVSICVRGPGGDAGNVTVVQRIYAMIDGQRFEPSLESGAWPADFQALLAFYEL
jgi:hypothetical protein